MLACFAVCQWSLFRFFPLCIRIRIGTKPWLNFQQPLRVHLTFWFLIFSLIQFALPHDGIKIAPGHRLLILILNGEPIPISLRPGGLMDGVELVEFFFLYWLFLLDCWVLVELLEVKWFLLSAEDCLLALDEVVGEVLGALSLWGFLVGERVVDVEFVEEVYLLLWLGLFIDRLLFC